MLLYCVGTVRMETLDCHWGIVVPCNYLPLDQLRVWMFPIASQGNGVVLESWCLLLLCYWADIELFRMIWIGLYPFPPIITNFSFLNKVLA